MHPKWNLFWQQTQNLQVSLNAQRDNSKQVYTYDVSSTSEKMEIVTRINSRVTSNANGNRNDGSP